jgi:diguanylate cyclase (GGDEF)-like protein
VEKPSKPVIRIGTPVFDPEGRKRGVVLLNYLGNDLISKILESEAVSEGQTMMLNSSGYWLISPNPEQEWGFMFSDEKRSFAGKYKEVWPKIRLEEKGQLLGPEGLFTFKAVYPLKAGDNSKEGTAEASGRSRSGLGHDEYKWHLVSFVPVHAIDSYSHHLLNKLFPFGIAAFLLVSNWSWLIAFAITKRRIFQERLQAMALFDSLTGLPNRRVFFDRLDTMIEQSKRYDAMFALLYIDLDGFKVINDTFGHETGDELLCQVADILKRTLRKSDTIARLGGDEFAVILVGIKNVMGAETAARKINNSLSKPIVLNAGTVQVGASIGIAIFPYDSNDSETLLRIADKYMYESKHKGKNTFTLTRIDIQ